MMPHSVIVAERSLRDFFRQAIASALELQAMQVDNATSTYLVELLCSFASAGPLLDQPLVSALASAEQEPDPGRSIQRLKRVGDQSLYVAGYFGDSLRSRELDQGYYTQLGSTAYRRLCRYLRRAESGTQLVVVFSELGDGFDRFVEVLTLVRHHGEADSADAPDDDLGQLYARWRQTRDPGLARRLRRAGMVVLQPPRTKQ
jgi:hypothetical protein